MYFQDEVQLPALIPVRIKRKKRDEDELQQQIKSSLPNQVINILTKQFEKQQEQKQARRLEKPIKPALGPEKIDQFQRKFHNLQEKGSSQKEQKSVHLNNYKQRENQKSKHIITDMMKKIDAKNVAEELYPITNQAILSEIKRTDKEVEELKVEAERKESLLVTNPNNQHLKKELEILKVSIDRCVTIKELYNEKINLRNKVSILERNIIKLKEENENLRIKNYRESENQENHSNGLPCYRERELKDELTKSQHELSKQKSMREKLENNISDIVQNFKRLYQEADTARLIVTKKLKEIQQKQKMIMYEQSINQSEKDALSQKKLSPKLQASEHTRAKKGVNSEMQVPKTSKKVVNYANNSQMKTDKNNTKALSMEDQIMKMRGNATTMQKNYGRK